jgi:tetratricopeptide (TPR) repeat protein
MISEKNNNDIQHAINLAKAGRIVESQRQLEKLIKKNRKNIKFLMLLAELNGKTGDFKGAVQNYKKVIRLAPRNNQAFTGLAMLYHSRGQFQKAEQYYKQAQKLDNNLPVVNFNHGLVLQEQGKYEDAQQRYLKAISLDPAYAKAYANLAYIHLQLNKIDESIGSYRKASELAPDVPEIYNSLGISLLRKGLTDEAEQCQRKALQLKPGYSEAWEGLGAVFLYNEKIEMAVDSYKHALDCDAKSVTALCGLASSLNQQGLHGQAQDIVEQALLLQPDHIEARLTQGNIFASAGKLDEALESCDAILEQSPKSRSALHLIASIYEKKAQPEKAYTYLQTLLAEPSSNIEAVLVFASISKSIDRTDEAILIMEDILENNPHLQNSYQRHLYFSLGKAHDSLKNYATAFDCYKYGNRLKHASFSISSFKEMIDANIRLFNEEFLLRTVCRHHQNGLYLY